MKINICYQVIGYEVELLPTETINKCNNNEKS